MTLRGIKRKFKLKCVITIVAMCFLSLISIHHIYLSASDFTGDLMYNGNYEIAYYFVERSEVQMTSMFKQLEN